MSYKISESKRGSDGRSTVTVRTKADKTKEAVGYKWWQAKSKAELGRQILDTAGYLKEQQTFRQRQASIQARLYGNLPLSNFAGSTFTKLATPNSLPVDRPTFNVIQSCIDTLHSRIIQSRPKPVFLTDGGDYKKRTLAKQMNRFINGEFYQTGAYEMVEQVFRDAAILGTGCLKIYENDEERVALERVLLTELYVDHNDAFYGEPRSMYQLKLVDRNVVESLFPSERSKLAQAEQAFPDSSDDATKTMSDQIMLVEAWHLPSRKGADDGRHTIACTAGVILDEQYDCDSFPFIFINYSNRLVGFWGQGLTEQLTGTQVEINKILVTISQSISLVGVPRVFVEDGSKVVKAHLNDKVGAIVTYRGTKPIYEVAPCVPQEMYAQLQRLIEYAYQQSGVSALSATSQKPAGLNSGQAIRSYDDLQSDRFAALNKVYNRAYQELACKIIELACDITERTGKYETVYPDKDGTQEICLPDIKKLDDPYVIQCFDESSLPRDPAGRRQTVVELMQSGVLSQSEGRRLLDFPDLAQVNKLANAAEERIYKQLDAIVEDGKYDPPDPFTDLMLAKQMVVQYYNLYVACGLEESRAEMLRTYQQQVLMLMQAAQPPQPQPMMAGAGAMPQAVPQARPQSEMLPQVQ